MSGTGWRGRVRQMWRSPVELDAEELRDWAREIDAVPVAEAVAGEMATVAGTLRTVTLRPRTGVPALEAELFDGTGTVLLVWLGRRGIRGITPGRSLVATGRFTRQGERLTMFNPSYELLPQGA